MALNRLSLSGNIKAKEMDYSDSFFKLKSEKVITSDSFSYNLYEALKDVNDFSTNNYSNLFLSRKMKNSEWLEANVKKNTHQLDIITTISFFGNDPNGVLEKGSWLYFDKNYEMWDINISSVNYALTSGRPDKNYANYIFHLNFIDENTCKICHTFGDITFYLSVDELLQVTFSKNDNENAIFQFTLDGENLILYKNVKHYIRDERDEIIDYYYEIYTLSAERFEDGSAKLFLSPDLSLREDNLIYITNNILDMDFYLDSSWVSYDRSQYINSINSEKSAFNLETQTLFHHQYNSEDTINFIPLKNNISYKGNTIRGNNLSISDNNYPDVDFRNYTTINSGLKQERGNDNIILNFLFNDQEYEVNDGEDLHITIPEKSKEGTNDMEPLWPYRYINIKDTKFIKNGAFGSDNPAFADKFKRYQGHISRIVDGNNEQLIPNNGTYLCTWLYKKDHESEPIWMDRYYYPDFVHRNEIIDKLSNEIGEDTFKSSRDNILDNAYLKNDETKDFTRKIIKENVYFDKISDVIIEPGCSYIYSRLSKEMVNEKLDKLEPYRIKNSTTKSNKRLNVSDYFIFDNENYQKIDYKDWNKTNAINFNTDIFINPDKKMGIQLFGTDYTDGFNIQNRKDVAPFHYYADSDTIYLLNNKFEIVHQFSVFEKYGDHIIKFFLGDVFDDVVVLSGIHLYIFAYDLRLKTRISLVATETVVEEVIKDESGDDIVNVIKTYNSEAVYGLDKLYLYREDESISLKNYPYGNFEKEFDTSYYEFERDLMLTTEIYEYSLPKTISNTSRMTEYAYNNAHALIPSAMVKMLSKSNSIIYKNNIYIPFEQDILKIILCPDCDKDFEFFTDTIRENYPAAARILSSNEYVCNFTRKMGGEYESISLESGFINVENRIKNIHIDEDGTIYAFNFDKIGVVPDGDTIYGLYANDAYIRSGGWYWLFNQSLSKMKFIHDTSKYAEFASNNSIDMVRFNERGEMALVRNFHNLPDNNYADNNKRIDIYDKTKKKIYTYDLSSYDEILSLDSFNYINEGHEERTVFCMLAKAANGIYVVEYVSDTKEVVSYASGLPFKVNPCFYETTNSNAIMRYKDSNALYFNLHAPSPYLYDYIATIKWSLEDKQTGWYNINVKIDLDAAIFEVRINDELLESITEKTHSWFKPYVYSNGTTFDSSYYIGCVGKKYGTTLNNILKNSVYDPYVCKNSKLENTLIYNKSLNYSDYQAIRLRNKSINKIILTLPCGTRNSLDEIVRYFKYNAAGAMSNKIKINISGTGLETQGEFDLLRKEIETVLENNKDCLVDVKEIEFI